jgi:hypothetical protein
MKLSMNILAAVSAMGMIAQINDAAAAEAVVSSGVFRGGPHAPADTASGIASLIRLESGRYELRLSEDFITTNGPDLFIYLSAAEDPKDDKIVAESAFLDAGKLKSPTGGQRFLLPAEFDRSKFKSVVVWCKRFSVLFGAARLVSK